MANVRVTCPTCNAELEIGEEHLGQEVECGSCLGAFLAEDPATKKKPYKMRRTEKEDRDEEEEEDRPRKKKRRRRRRDDDDDDYDYSPPGYESSGGGTGLAVTSLVLGILSFPLLCCCYLNVPVSLAGIVCGAIAMYKPQGKGLAITGLILSILSLVVFGGFFALAMNPQQFGGFGR